jgi:glycosyltransferase involved in cell wall biosynthesis
MQRPVYSIIIPAYNESERLQNSLEKVMRYTQEQGWDAEVIVVNDGSRDDTGEVVRQIAASNRTVRLIDNPGNRGKGYSVRNGMLNARGELLLFSDADFSSPIEEAPKLFSALQQGADVAIGSRWLASEMQTERQPAFRQLIGRIFNFLLRVVLGLKFSDTQCGFKAFTAPAARLLFSQQKIERWGFDPELLFLAVRAGLTVREVPVFWAHDHRTKLRPVKDGARMFLELLRIRWYALTGRYSQPVPVCAGDRA